MATKIFFDMDGTVADLYNFDGWLEALKCDTSIFRELSPLVDMTALIGFMKEMWGHTEFGIITWTPMEASYKFHQECAEDKIRWIQTHMAYITTFTALPYGTPKQDIGLDMEDINILIDDNPEIINTWKEDGFRGELVTSDRSALDIIADLYKELKKD